MTRRPKNTNPHAVLFDAARQLRAAAKALELAAADFITGQGPAEGRRRLRLAESNLHAALARLASYEAQEPAQPARTSDECPECSTTGAGPLCKAHRPQEGA